MGKLTTHVLDTAAGIPGADIALELYRLDGAARSLVVATRTNADGRCDEPLMIDSSWQPGTYELCFDVASYFAATLGQGQPPFLDTVTLRVTLVEDAHYHVPLLVSPWSYSTYRGS